ncbi:MAG: cytochrome c3 family protein [Gemmatimonadota bacterium]|nr:cytochrome c3 family protein [Gemmatimonadota bacterium]
MNTRQVAALLALAGLSAVAPAEIRAQESESMCVECHAAIGDDVLARPVAEFADDVHAENGFGCVDCHGGDPTVGGFGGMDPELGFIGVPRGRDVIAVCGRCHSNAEFMHQYDPALRVDQVTEYWTSTHGQRLSETGDTAVAVCSDCHHAHGIRRASTPLSPVHPTNVAATCGTCHADAGRMAPYSIPVDQVEKYSRSVHHAALVEQGDLSAPTCNDCHGNHGAAPPGISWVGNVCGQCHAVIAERFTESRHSRTFAALGMPGCATCHGNHEIHEASDEMLGLGEGAVCSRCHGPDDPGGKAATAMHATIDSLSLRIDSARAVLHAAEVAGMEISAAQADLTDAHSALVKARTAMHAFSADTVAEAAAPGSEIAAASLERGLAALADLRVRRLGLAASVAVILLFVLGLFLKIRERDSGSGESPDHA